MSTISNLERMKAQILERVKDCEERAMLESTRCRRCGRVWQRSLRQYEFQDIVNDLKLTFIKQRMIAVLITLTPGRRNEFIDCQEAKVRIAVLPILGVKTCRNTTLQLLERAYWLREFPCEWLSNATYSDYRLLCTTQD
jgi:hypothetical protein